jgi:elongation factor Ts
MLSLKLLRPIIYGRKSNSLSTAVTAAMVKELRATSNAPMMDCKKALSVEGGDMQKALNWLRTKGIAKVTNNTERLAQEGLICLSSTSDKFVTLLEINSETDFVSMNKDFQNFMVAVSSTITEKYSAAPGPISIEELLSTGMSGEDESKTVQDSLNDLISIIREKLVIKRAENIFPASSGGVLAGYVHGKVGLDHLPANIQLGKQAAVVSFDVTNAIDADTEFKIKEMGKRLAMHTVAAKPHYLTATDVPPHVLEQEMAIFTEQSKDDVGKKKPEIIEKIIQGKVHKRMSELTLMGQSHVVEEGNPVVQKFVSMFSSSINTPLSLASFKYWQVGS